MIEIEGIVVDIRFRNEENYYTVFMLDTEDGTVTVVGKVMSISIGDNMVVSGKLIYHDQYGEQIALENYRKMMPTTIVQIEKYLSSGIIPFIGDKIAKQIVKLYGAESLNIITETPEVLLSIRGIGRRKLDKIKEAIEKERDSREVLIYLQSLGIGNKTSMLIYKTYLADTIQIIESNPYRLIEDIKGVGFNIADEIAIRNNIEKTDLFRISAGVVYYLNQQANVNGNCYIELGKMIEDVSILLKIEKSFIENVILSIEIEGKIKTEKVLDQIYVYSRTLYDSEKNVVTNILRLILSEEDQQQNILDLIESEEIEYSETQKEAILQALYKKMLIITGGPGTGKTTIIKGIISLLEKFDMSFHLCAPTGRAAKRMEESTGKGASTIHRLLGYKSIESQEGFLEYNRDNPLKTDCIIVDEVSMIDIYLMSNLLNAIDTRTKLILVGDVDQLPSVGPGNVLKDLIDSQLITTIRLDRIFRQEESSNIIKNAHLINSGERPILNQEDQDFFFIRTRNETETLDTVIDLISNRLPNHYKVDPMKDIQILSAMKKGICGVDNLNSRLQGTLNPQNFNKEEIEIGKHLFREGDKVMQTKNNYDLDVEDEFKNKVKGVYNGDMGFIRSAFTKDGACEVIIDDKKVVYDYKAMTELALSYAITIHKSQGSEFPIVVIPMVSGPYMLLSRNILYTAITRGKELVVLVGDEGIMNRMIENNFRQNRNSTLAYFLRKSYAFYEENDI